MPNWVKTCKTCLQTKPIDQFHKKASNKDGIDGYCKACKGFAKAIYLLQHGAPMNEKRFNSIYNGLSSIAKKVFDAIPKDSYWSSSRVNNELFRKGMRQSPEIINGVLNSLVSHGLLTEVEHGLFARAKITQPEKNQTIAEPAYYEAKEIDMPPKATTIAAAPASTNPFDELRAVAIQFLDLAKTVNELAMTIDAKVKDIETQAAENDEDMAKLKQLQSLLKSLG